MAYLETPSALAANEESGKKLLALSGSSLLEYILDGKKPKTLIQSLPEEDFFWIIKRVGPEDCLPILELASEEQWHYLLDLEIWEKDILDTGRTLIWLKRLGGADSKRLSDWLFAEGRNLLSLLFYRTAEVVIKDGDKYADLSEGYFTLDGRFYIKAFRAEDRESVEGLLRVMADKDYENYQAFLYGLAYVIPAESEEELYRLRNNRLAEHGFLPYEDALAVYAPLSPAVLADEMPSFIPGRLSTPESGALIPLSPLMQVEEARFFVEAIMQIDNPLVRDRVCLEFAGLSNRIIAAEAIAKIDDPEVLAASCRRAADYLNVALETLCGNDLNAASELLGRHALMTIFRIGYGYAMSMHWEAERWRKTSWYVSQGWENDFWGAPWGETIEGLITARPCFFAGDAKTPYRDFECVEDLEQTKRRLTQVQALDSLLAGRSKNRQIQIESPPGDWKFYPLLFNRWAREMLGQEMSFAPLKLKDVRRFFRLMHRDESGPPYRMKGFKDTFIDYFIKGTFDFKPYAANALREALSLVWEKFCTEYENIKVESLKSRYSKFILIAGR